MSILLSIIVNSRWIFCFGWMSDASLATKNKNKRNNFYTTKIIEYYTKLTKIIIDGK